MEEESQSSIGKENIIPNASLSGIAVRSKRKLELKATSTDDAKRTALEGMNKALKKMEENDSFQVFGDFIASELRKIPNKVDADRVQRKLQRTLLDFMDELDNNVHNNVILWLADCERS